MLRQRLVQMKFNVPEEAVRVNFMPTEENLAQIRTYALDLVSRMK
jgi:flavorubredoxin